MTIEDLTAGEPQMVLRASGGKAWRLKNGLLHRVDGPAVERADGTKEWWTNGKPAQAQVGGGESW